MSNVTELLVFLPSSAAVAANDRATALCAKLGGLYQPETRDFYCSEILVAAYPGISRHEVVSSVQNAFYEKNLDTDGVTVLISESSYDAPIIYRFDAENVLRTLEGFRDLKPSLDRAEERSSSSLAAVSAARGDLDGAEKVIDGLSKQNDELRKENAELAERLASTATADPGISRAIDNIHLEQEVDELRDVIKGYKKTIEDMDSKNKHTEGEVSAMESFIDRLLDRIR